MGRFKESGIDSEEFHDVLDNEVGAVECWVCGRRFGQGNKGQTINVCAGSCLGYYCNDHLERHPNCEEGR